MCQKRHFRIWLWELKNPNARALWPNSSTAGNLPNRSMLAQVQNSRCTRLLIVAKDCEQQKSPFVGALSKLQDSQKIKCYREKTKNEETVYYCEPIFKIQEMNCRYMLPPVWKQVRGEVCVPTDIQLRLHMLRTPLEERTRNQVDLGEESGGWGTGIRRLFTGIFEFEPCKYICHAKKKEKKKKGKNIKLKNN